MSLFILVVSVIVLLWTLLSLIATSVRIVLLCTSYYYYLVLVSYTFIPRRG